MVKKLTVDRFKSIRTATLELGRVNLFIGGNGAGKSNILEAIGVLSAAAYRGLGDSDLARKGVRITPPALMKSAFKNYEIPKTLQLTVEVEGAVTYKINLTGKDDDPLLAFFSESCTYGNRKMFGQGTNGVQVLGKSIYDELYIDRSIWDQVRTGHKFRLMSGKHFICCPNTRYTLRRPISCVENQGASILYPSAFMAKV